MKSPYITHITLSTGHSRRSPRNEVGDDILAVLVPWLDEVVGSGLKLALPVQPLSHFSASATIQAGALVCTLWAPCGPHQRGKPADGGIPMVTFGIAQRSRQGPDLWGFMVGQFGGLTGLKKPAEPWCGVVIHHSLVGYRGDIDWMGDFERCVSWAWITRHPDIASADAG